ncbi:hypothetical protein BTVI_62185 [Pitangus sulphuratus]|nr:hypothetical protein BTVI_62185 [Pitangus sulphuratus]
MTPKRVHRHQQPGRRDADQTNWCKQLQYTAVALHLHRASQTREDKFTYHVSHYFINGPTLITLDEQMRTSLFRATTSSLPNSHDWSAAMDGYKLFRRDRQGRKGGEVALYVRETLDSVELEVSDNKIECLWIRMKGKTNKTVILAEQGDFEGN